MVSARVRDACIDRRIDEGSVHVRRGKSSLVGRPAICAEHLWGRSGRVDLRRWILAIFETEKRTFAGFRCLETWELGRLGIRLDLRRTLDHKQPSLPSTDGSSHFGCIHAPRVSSACRPRTWNYGWVLRGGSFPWDSNDRFRQSRIWQSVPSVHSRCRIWALACRILFAWDLGWYWHHGANRNSWDALGHCLPSGASGPLAMHACSFFERRHSFTVDWFLHVQGGARVIRANYRRYGNYQILARTPVILLAYRTCTDHRVLYGTLAARTDESPDWPSLRPESKPSKNAGIL